MSRRGGRLARLLLDLLLGRGGRVAAAPIPASARQGDPYFRAFVARCLAAVYGPDGIAAGNGARRADG